MGAYLENIFKKPASKPTAPKITTPDNTAFGLTSPTPTPTPTPTASPTPKMTTPDNIAFGLTNTTKAKAPEVVSSPQGDVVNLVKTVNTVPAPSVNVTATPPSPSVNNLNLPPTTLAIKTATPDIVLFDEEAIDIDEVFDLIFENVGALELISISRSDIINGQKISYQPVKNLSSIQQRYNPNNIISLQQTADKYFAGFSIKLEDKIPNEGNGENGKNIYIDEASGDLIIELVNLNNDEQVETQITLSGTIYEINLGDYTS
jgi:hypothetical protein